MPTSSASLQNKAVSTAGGGTSRRIGYIDALKGFSILWVVTGHVAIRYWDLCATFPMIRALYNIAYSFHMPLFFMLSGYVFRHVYFDGDKHLHVQKWKWQLVNIGGVYMLFSLLYGVCKIVFSRYTEYVFEARQLLGLIAEPVGEYWFLYVLLEFYLFFALSHLARCRPWLLISAALVVSLLSGNIDGPFRVKSFCYFAFYFVVGMNFDECERVWSVLPLIFILLGGGIYFGSVYWYREEFLEGIRPQQIILAMGICLLLWYLFKRATVLCEAPLLKFLGRHSLEVYLLHNLLTAGIRITLLRLGVPEDLFAVFANILLSTALPVAAAFLCKKAGVYDVIFRIGTFCQRALRGRCSDPAG